MSVFLFDDDDNDCVVMATFVDDIVCFVNFLFYFTLNTIVVGGYC